MDYYVIAVVKINESKMFKLLPPYSSYLAPLYYFFFPTLKKFLGSKRFPNNKEVESAVHGYFKKLDGFHYKQGVEAIEDSLKKCNKLKKAIWKLWKYKHEEEDQKCHLIFGLLLLDRPYEKHARQRWM